MFVCKGDCVLKQAHFVRSALYFVLSHLHDVVSHMSMQVDFSAVN